MSGTKLLPCPFCGGTKIGWRYVEAYSLDSSHGVFGCEDCGVTFLADSDTEESCADRANWNRRSALSTLPIAAGKIVAWRTFNEDGASDVTERQDIADQWTSDGFEVSPLVVASTLPIAGEGKVKALVKAAKGDEPNRSGLRLPVRAGGNGYGGRGVTTTALNALADLIGHAKFVEANFGISYAHLTEAEDAFNAACKISSPGKDGGQEVEAVAWEVRTEDGYPVGVYHFKPNADQVSYYRQQVTPLYTSPSPQSTVDADAVIERLTKAAEFAAPALAALEGYEADYGEPLPDDHELGLIEDSRNSSSFRIRVGHIRRLASTLAALKAKSPSSDRAASEGIEAMRPYVDKLRGCVSINEAMGRVVEGQAEATRALISIFDGLAEAKGSGQ